MNDERYEILMTEYLNGDITPEREVELKTYLEQNEDGKTELFDLKVLNDQLGQVQVPEPGGQMSVNFYTMLEEHKQTEQAKSSLSEKFRNWWAAINYRRLAYNVAYGVVGILIGGLGMNYLNSSPTASPENIATKNTKSSELAVIQKKLDKMGRRPKADDIIFAREEIGERTFTGGQSYQQFVGGRSQSSRCFIENAQY